MNLYRKRPETVPANNRPSPERNSQPDIYHGVAASECDKQSSPDHQLHRVSGISLRPQAKIVLATLILVSGGVGAFVLRKANHPADPENRMVAASTVDPHVSRSSRGENGNRAAASPDADIFPLEQAESKRKYGQIYTPPKWVPKNLPPRNARPASSVGDDDRSDVDRPPFEKPLKEKPLPENDFDEEPRERDAVNSPVGSLADLPQDAQINSQPLADGSLFLVEEVAPLSETVVNKPVPPIAVTEPPKPPEKLEMLERPRHVVRRLPEVGAGEMVPISRVDDPLPTLNQMVPISRILDIPLPGPKEDAKDGGIKMVPLKMLPGVE